MAAQALFTCPWDGADVLILQTFLSAQHSAGQTVKVPLSLEELTVKWREGGREEGVTDSI